MKLWWPTATLFRRSRFLGFRTGMAALLLLGAQAVQALEITDDRGTVIQLKQSPQRIVSLLPSLTETVCALDQCKRLVGVDRYSTYPEMVRKLPQVGGGMDPNIEAIVALRPDVVLAATSSRSATRLVSLGIPVIALEPKTHADVQRVLGTVGALLGVGDAQKVWRNIDAGVSAAAQSLSPHVKGTRVYFEVDRGPYGASESSFIGETLTRLGVVNIIPGSLGPFPKLNPEYVVRGNPDVIMVGQHNAVGMAQRPGWGSIRAIRENRLCIFPVEESDPLVHAGPRMAESARILARCLNEKGAGPGAAK